MKKALFIFIGLVVVALFVWVRFADESRSAQQEVVGLKQPSENKTNSVTDQSSDISESIFVTYWGISEGLAASDYTEYYYFGITFDKTGNLIEEAGYKSLETYKNHVGSKKSYLVIRLIDSDVNKKILENDSIQKKIIDSSISEMENKSFEGILLDLEMSGLGFESTEKMITHFTQQFSDGVKKQNKRFYAALYGDTYYRARPYNVREIAKVSDKIIVMTYDFHKARGKGGPNFPFEKEKTYPYDFKTMIADFKKDVDAEKIEITFGMFGYDWGANDNEMATSYSYNKIKQDYLESCIKTDCIAQIDKDTGEGSVQYEEEGIKHFVWFETPESVSIKKHFAQEQGIGHFSYWAYSFF